MFVPQTHLPGAEAEVDFGEVSVILAGEMTRLYLFSLRLSYSETVSDPGWTVTERGGPGSHGDFPAHRA
ncbi:hypothetical protein ACFV2H_46895 [Streptomyces sp. NPDC059629]|uniref:hypothetical protein n=1 Tax=Streptomyces sp. NPDC059629 TaxID=3346889 RepID=UPI003676C582